MISLRYKNTLKVLLITLLCLVFLFGSLLGCNQTNAPSGDASDGPSDDTSAVETLAPEVRDGVIYYDGEAGDEAVFPTSYGSVSKVVDANDQSKVYYENGVWKNIQKNITNDLQTIDVIVYDGEDTVIDSNVKIYNVDKVISKASDLSKLYYSNGEGTTWGYYVVSNDILWNEADKSTQHIAKPYMGNLPKPALIYDNGNGFSQVCNFNGTFDGDGHKIEYGVRGAGLFGMLSGGAVVKNASFIVKKIDDSDLIKYKAGRYAILAGVITDMYPDKYGFGKINDEQPIVENVYAAYDIENFTPSLISCFGNTLEEVQSNNTEKEYCGLGLTSWSGNAIYKDVIVDMSNVKGVKEAVEDKTQEVHFGIFGGLDLDAYGASYGSFPSEQTFVNCSVIWDVPMIAFCRVDVYSETYNKYAIRTYADGEKGANAYASIVGNKLDSSVWANGQKDNRDTFIDYSYPETVGLSRVASMSELANSAKQTLASLGLTD